MDTVENLKNAETLNKSLENKKYTPNNRIH